MMCSKTLRGGLIYGLVFSIASILIVGFITWTAPIPAPIVPLKPVINIVVKIGPADGSVLFWQGGLLVKPINKHTGSTITHAAIIVDGYVYEAVPPCVHKVLLKDYLKEMGEKKRKDFTWFIMEPNKPYNIVERLLMRTYLNSQLGRPYMLRGWWKGHEVRGIFCSQLIGNAIAKTGRIKSENFRESPGSLEKKLEPIYTKR